MSNITFKPQPKVVVKIGRRGDAGIPVELGTSGDLLRWRYEGASSWTNLYDFLDLELPIIATTYITNFNAFSCANGSICA